MAVTKRKHLAVDYRNLHYLSSVVLYDTSKRPRNKFFNVDRIIEKRKVGHNDKYLIKWSGWPLHSCSWEPHHHLTPGLLRTYENPPMPDSYRLEAAGRSFHQAILTKLKGTSIAPVDAHIDLDVQRYLWRCRGIVSEHKGCKLYQKEDFIRFICLPGSWWYFLDIHGQGTAVDFPIKLRPMLTWTPAHFIQQNGKVQKAPWAPVERVKIYFSKRACSLEIL